MTLPPTTRARVRAYIGIGGNLGDARQQVETALHWLRHLPDTAWVAASPLYRSAPWQADGPDYVNAVAAVDTHLTAPHLLHQLQQLEQRAGRERPYLNAPRTLDLDLLLYGQGRIQSPTLTVPHPRWQERAFVLLPLSDLDPEWVTAEMRQAVMGQTLTLL